mmetsp:Transcript_90604/g.258843  ORF Transcript_90604/g.258843 Transcript_90604/m.258843 type:complete len:121 (+) Transcript_90604:118-480(+)
MNRLACSPWVRAAAATVLRREAAVVGKQAVRAMTTKPYNPQGANMSAMWKDGPFRSNAEELVDQVPVIEVEGMTAICNGGGGALGHPIEYIQLNTARNGKTPMVEECKYCGLRFVHKPKH